MTFIISSQPEYSKKYQHLNSNKFHTTSTVMIIDRELIRSLGFDSHGTDMTIHWDDASILWRDIYSTTNNVFALSQHNAAFNSETKRMKLILDAKYSKDDIKTIAESSTNLDFQEINDLYTLLKKYECLFDGNLGTWHTL